MSGQPYYEYNSRLYTVFRRGTRWSGCNQFSKFRDASDSPTHYYESGFELYDLCYQSNKTDQSDDANSSRLHAPQIPPATRRKNVNAKQASGVSYKEFAYAKRIPSPEKDQRNKKRQTNSFETPCSSISCCFFRKTDQRLAPERAAHPVNRFLAQD